MWLTPPAGASASEPASGPSAGATSRLCSSCPWLTNSRTTFPAGTVERESAKLYSTAVTCTCGTDGGERDGTVDSESGPCGKTLSGGEEAPDVVGLVPAGPLPSDSARRFAAGLLWR